CLLDAGLPKEVAQAVFGVPDEVSRHLLGSPVIRKLSFTGSTVVGKHLMRLAADNMLRTTMELGGHGPVLI
ncbi:MAG: aldehyde dehydrogenase family protein, partial [Novosphingobium sp.]